MESPETLPTAAATPGWRAILPWRALLLVAIVYSATLGVLEPRGFWIVDNANKYLQLRGIVANRYRDFSIPWPGQEIDPGLHYNPMPYAFSEVREGRLYSIFSPVFATLSSIPDRLFGFYGLYLLPCLATLLTLVAMAAILARLGATRRAGSAAVLLAAFCTPLWFYSVTFWEHTLSVCAGMWAVWFYVQARQAPDDVHRRRALVRGAALAALAVYFRDDMLPFCAAALGVTVAHAPGRRLRLLALGAAATVATLLPLWFFQWWAIGSPFGFHLEKHLTVASGITQHVLERPRVFYNLLIASGLHAWPSELLALPFLLAFALRPRASGGGGPAVVVGACAVAGAASLLVLQGYVTSGRPVQWMDATNSLFNTTPVLMVAFLRGRRGDSNRTFLWQIALAFTVVYCLAAPAFGTRGVHWGCRYLLLLYPLLALLAGLHIDEWWRGGSGSGAGLADRTARAGWLHGAARAGIVLVVLVSLAGQLFGIDVLRRKKEFSRELNDTLLARPETAIITDVPWAAQECFDVFYSRNVFVTLHTEQLADLLQQLGLRGIHEVLFLSHSGAGLPAPLARIEAPGLDYFSLQLYSLGRSP